MASFTETSYKQNLKLLRDSIYNNNSLLETTNGSQYLCVDGTMSNCKKGNATSLINNRVMQCGGIPVVVNVILESTDDNVYTLEAHILGQQTDAVKREYLRRYKSANRRL